MPATGGLHHPARAKHVIFLFMNGGLSQVDSFDPKPMLTKITASRFPAVPWPPSADRLADEVAVRVTRYGKSGLEVSEIFPHIGACIDDICVIRSMHTDIPNHEPAMLLMHTGHVRSAVRRSGRGSPTGSGTETRTCLDTWCSVPTCRPR